MSLIGVKIFSLSVYWAIQWEEYVVLNDWFEWMDGLKELHVEEVSVNFRGKRRVNSECIGRMVNALCGVKSMCRLSLSLENIKLNDEQLQTIVDGVETPLRECIQLKELRLNLSNNRLEKAASLGRFMCDGLIECTLNLNRNRIKDISLGIFFIPSSLESFVLDLTENPTLSSQSILIMTERITRKNLDFTLFTCGKVSSAEMLL